MKISTVISAIEAYAPPTLQESYDNTGYQVGDPDAEATGALLCIDVTEEIVDEALNRGINLIISHHPLLFRGVKCVIGQSRPERVLAKAVIAGITIYSSHTAMDSAVGGVSWQIAKKLQLENVSVLAPSRPGADTGLGVTGNLPQPMPASDFARKAKQSLGCETIRLSRFNTSWTISKVALCGGSAAEFIPDAIAAGAQAYITADCKLNHFLDYAHRILLIDAGHFETEQCTKEIFFNVLTEKFPNFAVYYSDIEKNPIIYL